MESKISFDEILKNIIKNKNQNSDNTSWQQLSDTILGYQNKNHLYANQLGLCDTEYKPGTFTISEISEKSKFLENPISFDKWIENAINDEINLIKKLYPEYYDPKIHSNIIQNIILILNLKNENLPPLKNYIYYQEYPDIIRRLILTLMINDPNQELNIYPHLKQDRLYFIISVLNYLDHKNFELKDWLHFSIAAGMLGIDEKSVHAATSAIDTHMAIKLPPSNSFTDNDIIQVSNRLIKVANSKCRIDATDHFFQIIQENMIKNYSLVSLPDDYLESIFLLKFYEKLLKKYSKLQIYCIPKSKICGNDATYEDIKKLMKFFPYLKNNKRFELISDGPVIGGCNIQKMSENVLDIIEKSQLIDVRGARNYEMLQGLNKEVFFGFIVCREISESLTGLFADNIPFIYLHQSNGEKSFKGFKERYRRIKNGKMFALKTVYDNKIKWE